MNRSSQPSTGPTNRARRPVWQWLVGLGLIAAAGVHYAYRAYEKSSPGLTYRPIEVDARLKPAERIPATRGTLSGANIILITMDTTRADRLRCYGNADIKTPTLDQLAREGVLFAQARAVAPTTLPSHASILTGLYPVHHQTRVNGLFRLPEETQTLAEDLRAAGYRTGAVISAFVLDSQFGLAQGFDTYDDDLSDTDDPETYRYRERTGDQTAQRAIDWISLGDADRAYFLWVHFFDPHAVYEPPPPYDTQYPNTPYDGEIAFVDSQIRRIVEAVEARGETDRTLFVVLADHGEDLGQHGEMTHAYLAYDATLHVPLIMRCGGRLGGGIRIDERVSQVDVAPTILSLVGVDGPPMDGRDLTETQPDDRLVFAETLHGRMIFGWAPIFAAFQRQYKYLHSPIAELFDLDADPGETRNLIAQQTQVASGLLASLRTLFGDELETDQISGARLKLDDAERRRLEALGYVGAGVEADVEGVALPDPKLMVPAIRAVEDAVFRQRDASLEVRIAELEEAVRKFPDFQPAYRYLADAYALNGDVQRAAEIFEEGLKYGADIAPHLTGLAQVHLMLGHWTRAIEVYEKLLKLYPEQFDARYRLAQALREVDRPEDAEAQMHYIFDRDPSYEDVALQLVTAHAARGQLNEIQALLEQHLAATPGAARVRTALAECLMRQEKYGDVFTLLRDWHTQHPEDRETAANLALFWLRVPESAFQRPQQGISMLERLCADTRYEDSRLLYSLATAYTLVARLDEGIAIAERAGKVAAEQGEDMLITSIDALLKQQRELRARRDQVSP